MKSNAAVAKRIQREIARLPKLAVPEGVHPLNPGFFLIERIRDNTSPKRRKAVRVAMKEHK